MSKKTPTIKSTLSFLKRKLSGIEFAITGSYAESVLDSSNRFSYDSDLDIIVSECDIEKTAERLLNSPNYISINRVHDYGSGYPSRFIPFNPYRHLKKPSSKPRPEKTKHKKDKPEKSRPKKVGFSEYLLEGKLTSIHLIGSYKENGREVFEIDGIRYVKPIPSEYLSLAA